MLISELNKGCEKAAGAFGRLLAAVPVRERPARGEDAFEVRQWMERLFMVAQWVLAWADFERGIMVADPAAVELLHDLLNRPTRFGLRSVPAPQHAASHGAPVSAEAGGLEPPTTADPPPVEIEVIDRQTAGPARYQLRIHAAGPCGVLFADVAQVHEPLSANPLLVVPRPLGFNLVTSVVLAALNWRKAELERGEREGGG